MAAGASYRRVIGRGDGGRGPDCMGKEEKSMKKRILAFFLAFTLCLGLSGQAFAAWEPEEETFTESCGIVCIDRKDSTTHASGKLSAAERGLYNLLKEKFRQVADGQLDSSVFTFDVTSLGIYRTGPGQLSVNDYNIQLALLLECPYEQYWFDKTEGWVSSFHYNSSNRVSSMIFECHTAQDYAQSVPGENRYYIYKPDTNKTKAAAAAMGNARNLVQQNSGKSDYEKLVAYKDYICGQVEYDHDAVKYSDANGYYGAPWQLINVFDNNPQTNVVCEGYSKAFQYLCDLSSFSNDIECYQATGRTTGDHMWNTVRVNGRSYMADLTACDSERGQSGDWFLAGSPNATGSGFTIYAPRYDLPNGWYYNATTDTYTYDSDTKSVYDSSILTLTSTGLKPADLSGSTPTPTPTPEPTPDPASGLETDFAGLTVHEIAPSGRSLDDREYTLGSIGADVSVLVLGSVESTTTLSTLKTVQTEMADLGVRGGRIYLMEVRLNDAAGIRQVREYVEANPSYVHVAATSADPNPYDLAFWDVSDSSDGVYAQGATATMPALVVLDKNCRPVYYASYKTFDQGRLRAALSGYAGTFSDVDAGAFYNKAVNWAVSGNITTGTSDTKFSPTQNCTHAQIITFLWRAMGEPRNSQYVPPAWVGVQSGNFAYDALGWAYAKGMLTNLSANGGPDGPCTRAQAMDYIWGAFGRPGGGSASFSDIPASMYYADAVSWAVDLGVTNGTGGGKFSPDTVCNRGTIVTFLHRAFVEEVRVK